MGISSISAFLTFLQLSWAINPFNDITGDIFNSIANGTLVAFGDFNADKHTDLFLITHQGKGIDLLLSYGADDPTAKTSYRSQTLLPHDISHDVITSVVPADFNGDAAMDVLITTKKPKSSNVQIEVHWGDGTKIGEKALLGTVLDEPTIIDYNADMIPDILAETSPGERKLWIGRQDKAINATDFPGYTQKENLKIPHSNAFVDCTNDYNSDIIVTSSKQVELWTRDNADEKVKFKLSGDYKYPASGKIFGQLAFVDIDENKHIDQLMPVCEDTECHDSRIYILSKDPLKNKWRRLPVNFTHSGTSWGFVPPHSDVTGAKLPITLRMGDFNMDGFPDALAILRSVSKKETTQRAFVLQNIPCSGGMPGCDSLNRTFRVLWSSGLSGSHVQTAAFFDFYDDGKMDVVTTECNMKSGSCEPSLKAFKNNFAQDACFLKVHVLSGLCNSDCGGGRKPYGVNQYGSVVQYAITPGDSPLQGSCATQLSQSAHRALQLPFILFGLGQTPNFVDSLTVGIPTASDQVRKNSWKQLIPNSQVVVIPFPLDKAGSWEMLLYVTPSRTVLLTAVSLLGTCGVIAAITGLLHWAEKREDAKEKRQEAHKFHFDAM